jgi:HlyD family secretion protein
MKFDRPSLAILLVGFAAVSSTMSSRAEQALSSSAKLVSQHRVAAAPGVVEPNSKEREISAQIVGVIKEFKVEENDEVTAGQIIAVIDNAEQNARVASAQAQLALRQAELDRILHGARGEELREAKAALSEADAGLKYARRDYERRLPLAKRGVSPQAVLDQAKATLDANEARRTVAAERLAQLETGARPEDIDAARARLRLADAELASAKAMLDKTFIRSPVAGTVLRRAHEVGETVTNVPPTAVAIIGDLRGLKVRAEVDETDIGKVTPDQRVEVVSDAYPGRRFQGRVSWVSFRMGSKFVQTGRPADRVDTKVLQVLIDLDEDAKLPVGLRVDAYLFGELVAAKPAR